MYLIWLLKQKQENVLYNGIIEDQTFFKVKKETFFFIAKRKNLAHHHLYI